MNDDVGFASDLWTDPRLDVRDVVNIRCRLTQTWCWVEATFADGTEAGMGFFTPEAAFDEADRLVAAIGAAAAQPADGTWRDRPAML
jgi:hypothetical protein